MHEKENLKDRKPTLMQALQMWTPYSLSSPDIPESLSYIIKFTNYILKCKNSSIHWPNLKNLSGGLNLSRGLNMVGSTENCIKCFKS